MVWGVFSHLTNLCAPCYQEEVDRYTPCLSEFSLSLKPEGTRWIPSLSPPHVFALRGVISKLMCSRRKPAETSRSEGGLVIAAAAPLKHSVYEGTFKMLNIT